VAVDGFIVLSVETIGTVLAVVGVAVFFRDETAVADELDMGDFSSFKGSVVVVVVCGGVAVVVVLLVVVESLFS
jgi:hypothetical protein